MKPIARRRCETAAAAVSDAKRPDGETSAVIELLFPVSNAQVYRAATLRHTPILQGRWAEGRPVQQPSGSNSYCATDWASLVSEDPFEGHRRNAKLPVDRNRQRAWRHGTILVRGRRRPDVR